jgi:surface polysaccharide O-acyltransferase-like enzyme
VDQFDPEAKHRYVEVDVLKTVAIVVVVLIHSMRSAFGHELSPLERWIGLQTRFAVPAFLMVSGFLYATTESREFPRMLRRLRRILVPYLFASLLAQGWSHWTATPTPTGSFAVDLAFGSSFGPYYYIFVITTLVFFAPVLARLNRWVLPVGITLAAFQWALETGFLKTGLGGYWEIRNPLFWWAYFVAGWGVRRNYGAIIDWLRPRRALAVVVLAAVVVTTSFLSFTGPSQPVVRTAAWINIYAISAFLFAAAGRLGSSPAVLRTISDATYPIYLLHLFFVYEMARRIPGPATQTEPVYIALSVALGVTGSLVVVFLGRKLLGERSRDVIGA